MRKITSLILATTALSFELNALVATQNAPRMTVMKDPSFNTPSFNTLSFNAQDAKASRVALPRAVLQGKAQIEKIHDLLSIKAKTDFTHVDFMLAGPNQNIITEKEASIKIEQPTSGTFLANFGNFNDSRIALHKGTITAKQGHLVMANPAGFMFEDGSKVDVSRLTVLVGGKVDVDGANNISMRNITHKDAVFISRGDISLSDAGLSSFVAPHMAHFGKIIASKGNVQLRAGVVAVDLYNDGQILIEAKEVDLQEAEKLAQENLGEKGLYLLSGTGALDVIKGAVNTGNNATHAHIEGADIIITAPVVALKKTNIVASTTPSSPSSLPPVSGHLQSAPTSRHLQNFSSGDLPYPPTALPSPQDKGDPRVARMMVWTGAVCLWYTGLDLEKRLRKSHKLINQFIERMSTP